jgi:hypothetical protein
MEQIIYELNGKKYLLVEVVKYPATQDKIKAICYKYNCIYQGVKEINRGWLFSTAYAVEKYLVPEEHIEAFNREEV